MDHHVDALDALRFGDSCEFFQDSDENVVIEDDVLLLGFVNGVVPLHEEEFVVFVDV